jgi:hypothetical protein
MGRKQIQSDLEQNELLEQARWGIHTRDSLVLTNERRNRYTADGSPHGGMSHTGARVRETRDGQTAERGVSAARAVVGNLGRILHSPAQDLEQIALLLGRVQFRCSTWEVNLGLHSRNTNDKHLEHLKMLYYRTADICESPSC